MIEFLGKARKNADQLRASERIVQAQVQQSRPLLDITFGTFQQAEGMLCTFSFATNATGPEAVGFLNFT